MDIKVYNAEGAVSRDDCQFDDKMLGDKVRTKLLHQAIIRYEANKRLGTHKIKSKAQRSGSGVKPWKQKQHGSRSRRYEALARCARAGGNRVRSASPRDYHKGMPVRMRREALFESALLSKIKDKQLKVIDHAQLHRPHLDQDVHEDPEGSRV